MGPARAGATSSGRRSSARSSEEEVEAEITRKFPIGAIPADEDVAEVVALFCSDRMRMVTGQFLRVDGGEKLG